MTIKKTDSFSARSNNIWVSTHADFCASTAVHISSDPPCGSGVFIGATCPSELAFMGLTRELRPGNFSTSALEQPSWALV